MCQKGHVKYESKMTLNSSVIEGITFSVEMQYEAVTTSLDQLKASALHFNLNQFDSARNMLPKVTYQEYSSARPDQ